MAVPGIPIKEIEKQDDSSRLEFVRNVIFERAVDLFLEKSFRGTSMNQLAQACGVSKPALYHYFRNKSHLLETLYDVVTREFFENMEQLARTKGSPTERMRKLVVLQTVYNIANGRFLTVFWRERREFDEESRQNLARKERAFEALVVGIIDEGREAGEFAARDSHVAAMGILGMLSTAHRWASYVEATPDDIAASLSDLVIEGLTARRG